MELRDDDAFWAAQRVAAFTDDMIRAIVHTGEISNPAAEKYLADVLIERREKIKSIYLTQVNPIVKPRLDAKGLTFENAAVAGGVATRSGDVPRIVDALRQRHRGDQAAVGNHERDDDDRAAPSGLPSSGFIAVDIAADSDDLSDVEAAGPRLLSSGRRQLEARRTRTDARQDAATQDVVNKVTWLWRARRRLSR